MRPAAERVTSGPDALMIGITPNSFQRMAPVPSTKAVSPAHESPAHAYGRPPHEAAPPVDHLLGLEGVPPLQPDLAVHRQSNGRCHRGASSNGVSQVTLRARRKCGDSRGIKRAGAATPRIPKPLEGKVAAQGCCS